MTLSADSTLTKVRANASQPVICTLHLASAYCEIEETKGAREIRRLHRGRTMTDLERAVRNAVDEASRNGASEQT